MFRDRSYEAFKLGDLCVWYLNVDQGIKQVLYELLRRGDLCIT